MELHRIDDETNFDTTSLYIGKIRSSYKPLVQSGVIIYIESQLHTINNTTSYSWNIKIPTETNSIGRPHYILANPALSSLEGERWHDSILLPHFN